MDYPDWTHQFRHVEGDSSKHTILNFTRNARTGQNADAGVDGDGLFDGFDIVELHRGVDFDAALTERLIDGLSDWEILFKSHKALAQQIGRIHHPLLGQGVRAVAYENHGLLVPWNHCQR